MMHRTIVYAVVALALATAFLAPLPTRAAEPKTECAQAQRSAQDLTRIASEIATLASRVETTGVELASYFQGQARAGFQSTSDRTHEKMGDAIRAMDDAFTSLHSQCAEYTPIDQHTMPLRLAPAKRTAKSQPWNFGAAAAAQAALQSDAARFAALSGEWRSAGRGLGAAYERAVNNLDEAQQALSSMVQAGAQASEAMQTTEKQTGGMFENSKSRPKPTAKPSTI